MLSATALVGMEPIAGMIDVAAQQAPAAPSENTQAELITSRNFLQNIVNVLSLRLGIGPFQRSTVFDSVFVDSLAQAGSFKFIIDKNNKENFLVQRRGRFFAKEITMRGKLAQLDAITMPGLYLRFNKTFLKNPQNFKFSIADIRIAVENLFNSISVSAPTKSERNTSFGISVKGKDYQLITDIVNTIADRYVQKNLNLRQARSQSMLAILGMQLEKTKAELAKSDERLKAYRSANPSVGLSQNTEQTISSLSEIQRSTTDIGTNVENARKYQEKLAAAPQEDILETVREALLFLNSRGNTSSSVFDEELTRLTGERRELLRTYDANHPLLIQNQTALNTIVSKAKAELGNYCKNQEILQTERNTNISDLSYKIRMLPTQELQLAELLRQQQANTDIYSRVLDKYNKAQVSDVVEVSDVYVMDRAVVPIPPPSKAAQLLGICAAFCLIIIFGPMILVDVISKTVRTETDLKRLLAFTVLESIPAISPSRRREATGFWNGTKAAGAQGKLISAEFNLKQEYIKELFRSLRTKIMLRLHDVPDKSMLITSLDAGAGKSTITANIGIAFAQQNIKTIIIDSDLRLGTLHELFNIPKSPGLSEFLSYESLAVTKENVMSIMRPTGIPNLSIIPSGRYADNAAELISSVRFKQLKNCLSGNCEIILCDSPPLGVAADAMSVNNSFAHYLIVVRAGKTNIIDLKKKINEYPALSSKLLGIVLNCAAVDNKLKYYKYSKYH